jgi:hypothetical protein
MPAKQNPKKTPGKPKAAARELLTLPADKRYVRRNQKGQFQESDDVGASLSQDRKRSAKTVAKPARAGVQRRLDCQEMSGTSNPVPPRNSPVRPMRPSVRFRRGEGSLPCAFQPATRLLAASTDYSQ